MIRQLFHQNTVALAFRLAIGNTIGDLMTYIGKKDLGNAKWLKQQRDNARNAQREWPSTASMDGKGNKKNVKTRSRCITNRMPSIKGQKRTAYDPSMSSFH